MGISSTKMPYDEIGSPAHSPSKNCSCTMVELQHRQRKNMEKDSGGNDESYKGVEEQELLQSNSPAGGRPRL
jgi:hypothetical protein